MEKLLQKYARFLVSTGVNVQAGQTFLINAPIDAAFFARLCAQEAYALGAREVVVHYNDEKLSRIKMEHTDIQVLEDVPPWQLRSYLDYVERGAGACVLSISAHDPEIYKGLDTEKINRATNARQQALKPWRDLTMGNRLQWCVASIPSEAWAKRIFPQDSPQKAMDKLWQAIYAVCYVDETGDPAKAWRALMDNMKTHVDLLNQYQFESLRFTSQNGTDFTVGLAEGHLWTGAEEKTSQGKEIPFIANIPTQEVFTAPHCRHTEGIVKSSMPYVYNGNLIEKITARFQDGLVTQAKAERGDDLLQQMLNVDAGARRIGEIALVPASSSIKKTGLLFYNTLFDENAACHMAFGMGYPGTIQGGNDMDREALAKKGLNESLIHEDIMIGTEDMDITGKTKDGREVPVFKMGEWAIE